MAGVAIIAPTKFLTDFSGNEKYHLCLSGQMKDPAYLDFYRDMAQRQGRYVIMDNSAHETGYGDASDALLYYADKLNPQEVVLPDRLFFGEDTLEESEKCLQVFRKLRPDIHLMGVPQGRTVEEWTACLTGLLELGVDTIGISKDYEVWPGSLKLLVGKVLGKGRGAAETLPEIHMLGWGRNLSSLAEVIQTYGGYIRSVDSAKPLVYALNGISINRSLKDTPRYPKRVSNYFGLEDFQGKEDLAWDNIKTFRKVAVGAIQP